MIFLIILIIVFIYYNNSNKTLIENKNDKSKALERLKKRYIDGEISESKYLEMKKNI